MCATHRGEWSSSIPAMTTYVVNATLTCPAFLGSPEVMSVELYICEYGSGTGQVSKTNVLSDITGAVNTNLRLVTSTADIRASAPISLSGSVTVAPLVESLLTVILAKQVVSSTQSMWYIWGSTVHPISQPGTTPVVDALPTIPAILPPVDPVPLVDPVMPVDPVLGDTGSKSCVSFTLRDTCPREMCTWTGRTCNAFGALCEQGFVTGTDGICVSQTAPPLEDGAICANDTTCLKCKNKSTYWWTKAGDACGTEPAYADGTTCAPGTSCAKCANTATSWSDGIKCGKEPATLDDGQTCARGTTCLKCKSGKSSYWWTKSADACGTEEKLAKGQTCAAGTTCNACASPAKFWLSKGSMACGSEALEDGKHCIKNSTCADCKSGSSSYWYSLSSDACGTEPGLDDGRLCNEATTCKLCKSKKATRWSDGFKCGEETRTLEDGAICANGTTCLQCKNKSTYWWVKAGDACGTEPAYADGTTCAPGTSCAKCANTATAWSDGIKCGKEPATLDDGQTCAKGTTCLKCKSGKSSYWWTKASDACGTEEKLANGQTCAAGTTCNACASPAKFWMSKSSMACGPEALDDGRACSKNTTCADCKSGSSTYWYSLLSDACGTEVGRDNGQLCDEATTCKLCKSKKATRWSDGFKCGEEIKTLDDGQICAKDTTCLKCKSGKRSYWYSKASDACGTEPAYADGTKCALGTSCVRCTQTATMWSDGNTKCGTECPAQSTRRGVNCYRLPGTGYDWTTPDGVLIGKICPTGTTDTGTTCTYDRGAGRTPNKSTCASGLRDDGTSCWKDAYANGVGSAPVKNACPSDTVERAGDCWTKTSCQTTCTKRTCKWVDKGHYNYTWGAINCGGRPNSQCNRTWIRKDVQECTGKDECRTVNCPSIKTSSANRGASCPSGKSMVNGLCYTTCKSGFSFASNNGTRCVPTGRTDGYIATTLSDRQSCSSGSTLISGLCHTNARDGFTCAASTCSMSKDVKTATVFT